MNEQHQAPWWRTRWGMVLICLLTIGAFFLITEHTAHVFGVLPYLFLLMCPLMHLFMHQRHGDHDHGSMNNETGDAGKQTGGKP